MIEKILKTFVIVVSLFCPMLGYASSCDDIVTGVYTDTQHYASLISSQHLPWMNLTWLKKNLGAPQVRTISNQKIRYTWHCANQSYLIAYSDSKGTLTKVSGRYNSDQGTGMFYSFLEQDESSSQPAIITKPKP